MAYRRDYWDLEPESLSELNTVLHSCDLLSFSADQPGRLAVITLAVEVLPPEWPPTIWYPLVLALHPVGRIAASHRVGDSTAGRPSGEPHIVRPMQLPDVNQVISTFSTHWIDDWDPIDPPVGFRFEWRDQLSLDAQWGGERAHYLELWQDDGPTQTLDIGVWFGQLYLLDADLRPIDRPALTAWSQRYDAEMARLHAAAGGRSVGVTSPPPPQIRSADVLQRLTDPNNPTTHVKVHLP